MEQRNLTLYEKEIAGQFKYCHQVVKEYSLEDESDDDLAKQLYGIYKAISIGPYTPDMEEGQKNSPEPLLFQYSPDKWYDYMSSWVYYSAVEKYQLMEEYILTLKKEFPAVLHGIKILDRAEEDKKESMNKPVFEGQILKKSDHLKNWNVRVLVIFRNRFYSSKSASESARVTKHPSMGKFLVHFDVEWRGKTRSGKRYQFNLISTDKHYRSYQFAWKNEEKARSLFNLFHELKTSGYAPRRLASLANRKTLTVSNPLDAESEVGENSNVTESSFERNDSKTKKEQSKKTLSTIPGHFEEFINRIRRTELEDINGTDPEQWTLLEEENNMKIFKSVRTEGPIPILKTTIEFPVRSSQLMYYILDVAAHKTWDSNIESLSLLGYDENDCEVWDLRHKKSMASMKKTQFTFSRLKCIFKESFLILDSHNDSYKDARGANVSVLQTSPTASNYNRGKILHSILMISPQQDSGERSVTVNWVLQVSHDEASNPETNMQITLQWMRSLSSLLSHLDSDQVSNLNNKKLADFLDEHQFLNIDESKLEMSSISIHEDQGGLNSDEEREERKGEDSLSSGGDAKPSVRDEPKKSLTGGDSQDEEEESANKATLETPKADKTPKNSITRRTHRDPDTPQVEKDELARENWLQLYGPDYDRREAGGISLTNKNVLKKQRNVLGHFLRKLGSNLAQGKSFMQISMPVTIFESKSLLEKLARNFSYGPIYLKEAARSNDPLFRFKYAIAYSIGMLQVNCEQKKPFNPIIGETYQGKIQDLSLFLEQTSHHPPVSNFYCEDADGDYTISGNIQVDAHFKANSVKGIQAGKHLIKFADGQTIAMDGPQIMIEGLVFGSRQFNFIGMMKLADVKNNLYADIIFNPDSKGFFGGMFSKQTTPTDHFRGTIYSKDPHDSGDELLPIKTIASISGIWTEYLEIDGERLYQLWEQPPIKLEHLEGSLESDCTKRRDLKALINEGEKEAQPVKEEMEDEQRYDAKLRKKGLENRKRQMKGKAKTHI